MTSTLRWHLLKHCSEEFSNNSRCIHRPLVVVMAYTASSSAQSRSGFKLSLHGFIYATRSRLKAVLHVLRSLPSTTDATDSKSLKSCSAERSRDASVALFVFSPNLTSQIAACPFLLSTSDSHKSRMYLDESILAWRQIIASAREASHKAIAMKQLLCVCWLAVSLCRQDHMRVVVSPVFFEKRQVRIVGNVEHFIWRNRLINILRFRKFNLSVECEPMLLKRMLHWYVDTL